MRLRKHPDSIALVWIWKIKIEPIIITAVGKIKTPAVTLFTKLSNLLVTILN